MEHRRKNRSNFQSLMSARNFFLEGQADCQTKLLVFTISNGISWPASHVPEDWLRPSSTPKDLDVEEVGETRKLKRGERGPGKNVI